MANVCQKCGVMGYPELLVHCIECGIFAEHSYCLDKTPERSGKERKWSCWQCSQKSLEVASTRVGVRKEELLCQDLGTGATATALKKSCKDSEKSEREKTKKRRTLILSYQQSLDEEAGRVKIGRNKRKKDTSIRDAITSKKGSFSLKDVLVPILKTNKKKRSKLISAYRQNLDEEAGCVKICQNQRDREASNGSAIATKRPQCSFSSKDDFVPILERLQPVSVRSYDFRVYDPLLKTSSVQLPEDCGYAQPFIDPIWSGYFDIHNFDCGIILAHLSNKACSRVFEGAKMLPKVLSLEKLPRCNAWPNSFKSSPPTDDHIGLYFFAQNAWNEATFNQLIHEMIEQDLGLKVSIGVAELLIFASILLPQQFCKFQGKWYLWGVFKGRLVHQLCAPDDDQSIAKSTVERSLPLPWNQVENLDERELGKRSGSPSNDNGCSSGLASPVHSEVSILRSEENLHLPSYHELHSPNNPKKFSGHGVPLGNKIDCGEDGDIGTNTWNSNLPCFEAPLTVRNDVAEKEHGELELFPLEVEDMAVAARGGGSGRFDLELGLGWSARHDGGPIKCALSADSLASKEVIF